MRPLRLSPLAWAWFAAGDDMQFLIAPSTADCSKQQYFNTIEQSCQDCAAITAGGAAEGNPKRALRTNAVACRCQLGYKRVDLSATCSDDGTCLGLLCDSCQEAGFDTSYSDNSGCVMCDPNTTQGVDPSTGDCWCQDGAILVETTLGSEDYLAAKYCALCEPGRFVQKVDGYVAGAFFLASNYTCQACPDPRMVWLPESGCECDEGYEKVGVESVGPQSCVESARLAFLADDISPENEPGPYAVKFQSIQETRKGKAKETVVRQSATMEHYMRNASALCGYAGGGAFGGLTSDAACQTLANLCVLTNYDLDSTACILYNKLWSGELGAANEMPRLFYDPPLEGRDVRADPAIRMKLTFKGGTSGREHRLRFRLAVFALNGTLVGFENLDTQMFYGDMDTPDTHKGGGPTRSTVWQRFGYSFRDHFRVKLSNLLLQDQLFYEVYLFDAEGDCGIENAECLYHVPIQNKVLLDEGGKTVNRNSRTSDGRNDIFTRRFVMYDVASGVESSSAQPKTVRYLVEIILHCEARLRKPNRIVTPYLELSYRERNTDDLIGGPMSETRVDFSVEYWRETRQFWRVADGFVFTWLAASVLYWIYAVRIWQVKQYASSTKPRGGGGSSGVLISETAVTPAYTWRCLVLYARAFVQWFFPLILLFCTYWFVFFKLQDTVFLLLPRENRDDGKDFEYYPIRTIIIVLWLAQTTVVLQLVYDQCAQEIFFIDWEMPREATAVDKNPVSVWRTIFVANEWNELQIARHTSLHVNLFGIAFVLLGLGLENNATPQPNLGYLEDGHHNIALRFANTTWWFLIFSFAQFLWNYCFYERFIVEPQSQAFLDICTVAKISVLVIDARFHGWYLHADSPYPHADDTMSELTRHLFNEANSEAVGRGLDHRLPEIQTFQLWLTQHFRRSWDEVRARATGGQVDSTSPSSIHSSSQAKSTRATQQTARAMDLINAFLRTFLLHGYREAFNLDWVIRLPNIVEKVTGQPPPIAQVGNDVVFEPDKPLFGGDEAWTSMTFLGNDWNLLLQEILTFAVADIWFKSTSLFSLCPDQFRSTFSPSKSSRRSIFLTFLLHYAVRVVRAYFGSKNLSERALIDARFLF